LTDPFEAEAREVLAQLPLTSVECPTCSGSGIVREAHEPWAVESLACHDCQGTGRYSKIDESAATTLAQALRRERNRTVEACAYIVENRSLALFISRAETVEAIRKLKVPDGE
jgi:DnaJ-class molecular chaperone